MTLRQRSEYGDGGDPDQPAASGRRHRAANLLGRACHRTTTRPAWLTVDAVDFKGNVLD